MIRSIKKYFERGGTQAAIAACWGTSRTQVNRVVKRHENLMVEFNVLNPRSVYKVWAPATVTTIPEKVYFEADKRSPDEDEVMG